LASRAPPLVSRSVRGPDIPRHDQEERTRCATNLKGLCIGAHKSAPVRGSRALHRSAKSFVISCRQLRASCARKPPDVARCVSWRPEVGSTWDTLALHVVQILLAHRVSFLVLFHGSVPERLRLNFSLVTCQTECLIIIRGINKTFLCSLHGYAWSLRCSRTILPELRMRQAAHGTRRLCILSDFAFCYAVFGTENVVTCQTEWLMRHILPFAN